MPTTTIAAWLALAALATAVVALWRRANRLKRRIAGARDAIARQRDRILRLEGGRLQPAAPV